MNQKYSAKTATTHYGVRYRIWLIVPQHHTRKIQDLVSGELELHNSFISYRFTVEQPETNERICELHFKEFASSFVRSTFCIQNNHHLIINVINHERHVHRDHLLSPSKIPQSSLSHHFMHLRRENSLRSVMNVVFGCSAASISVIDMSIPQIFDRSSSAFVYHIVHMLDIRCAWLISSLHLRHSFVPIRIDCNVCVLGDGHPTTHPNL